MKKLVIFDLDGTLLNTISDITKSINLALTDLGLKNIDISDSKYVVGSGVDILAQRTIKLIFKEKYEENKEYVDMLKEKYQYYYTIHQKDETAPYPNIIKMLEKLQENNIKIAVLSNKPHIDTVNVMNNYFNNVKFDCILGKIPENDIKPSPDGVFMIERKLNITKESDILYVGDTDVDIKTAKNANLKVLACTWGFRKKEELEKADKIIDDPFDIVKEAING